LFNYLLQSNIINRPSATNTTHNGTKSAKVLKLNVQSRYVDVDYADKTRHNLVVYGTPVYGRAVAIEDAYRFGKFIEDHVRPIIVRLKVPWDRRLVTSWSCLHANPELKAVFICAVGNKAK
jgi:hypothetical protein